MCSRVVWQSCAPEPWVLPSGTWAEPPASRTGSENQGQVRTLESAEPAGGWEALSLPSKSGQAGTSLLPPNPF